MYIFNCHAMFMLPLHVAPLILLRLHCAHTVLNHVVVQCNICFHQLPPVPVNTCGAEIIGTQ